MMWLSGTLFLAMTLANGCSSRPIAAGLSAEESALVQEDEQSAFETIDERAFYYFTEGLIFEQLADYVNAVASYKRAIKFSPHSHQIALSYAEALLRIREPQTALKVLKTTKPHDAEVYQLVATSYRMLGDEAGATEAYINLARLDSTNSTAYSYLAGYYRRQNNLDSAIWAYEHMARARPNNYRIYNELANLLTMRGDIVRAKEIYNRSLATNSESNNVLAALGLAQLFEMEQKFDSVRYSLQLGLQMEPDNAIINSQLSILYARMDSAEVALPYARRLTLLRPDDIMAARRLGILYLSIDSLDQADSVFTSQISSGDNSAENHFYLGRVAVLKKEFERALSEYSLVLEQNDSLAQNWFNLAFVYRNLEQSEKEITTYLTALNHVPDDAGKSNLLFSLGVAYERGGEVEKSVETFEEVLAIAPDNAQALNYLGYMLADRGERLEYAKGLISKAVELIPDNGAFLDSFGWVYFKLGHIDRAIKYLEEAVKLDSDAVIFDHLGDAYQAQGSTREARIWWQKALELQPEDSNIRDKLVP